MRVAFLIAIGLLSLVLGNNILQPETENWLVADGPPGSPGIFSKHPNPTTITNLANDENAVFAEQSAESAGAADAGSSTAAGNAAAAAGTAAAGGPLEVTVNCILKSVVGVHETSGQIELQAMIQLVWTDPKQTGTASGKTVKPTDVFNPDVQFLNSVQTELRKEKIMVYPNGLIRNTKRFYLTLQEHMNYHWYPFDAHMWSFDMNSFSKTSDKMVFKPGYVITDKDFGTAVFKFGKNEIQVRTVDAPLFPGQNFSTVRIAIVAKRETENAFQNIIFPLSVVACLGYLSFFISLTALPARSGLCIISILTTLVIAGNVGKMLPKISYTTWIDVFINSVLFLVASCCGFMVLAHRSPNKQDSDITVWDYYMRRIYPVIFAVLLTLLLGIGMAASPSEDAVLAASHDAKSFVA